jgi:hypothetical protein
MPIDIRRRKLQLSLKVMIIGMLIGLAWAGIQDWGLGRGYPYNTILCSPAVRFSDYVNLLRACAMSSPYREPFAIYFPGTYLFVHPLSRIDLTDGYMAVVTVILSMGILLLDYALRSMYALWSSRCVAAVALVLFSYSTWICFDRGNIEILMGLLAAITLFLWSRRRFVSATFVLGFAVCIKFYPILLFAVFIRRNYFRYLLFIPFLFLMVSLIGALVFSGSLLENFALWKKNFAFFQFYYLIQDGGLAGSASVWNLVKASFLTIDQLVWHLNPVSLSADIARLLAAYKIGFIALTAFLVYLVTFVETQFFRRVLLLLLLVTTSSPNGGDYKLVYINLALVLFILIPTRRKHDLWVAALLAFILVPKKEFFLTYLGVTDTGFRDVDIGVLVNPLCILMAGYLLILDCWRERIPHWSQKRIRVIFSPLRQFLRFRRSGETDISKAIARGQKKLAGRAF